MSRRDHFHARRKAKLAEKLFAILPRETEAHVQRMNLFPPREQVGDENATVESTADQHGGATPASAVAAGAHASPRYTQPDVHVSRTTKPPFFVLQSIDASADAAALPSPTTSRTAAKRSMGVPPVRVPTDLRSLDCREHGCQDCLTLT